MSVNKYITKLTKEQTFLLKKEIHSEECRRKCLSVLSYITKHCNLNNGAWSKSFSDIHKMYIRYHKHMSLSNLKKIINKLYELELIYITKCGNKNIYFVDPKVAEKVAEKYSIETKENSRVDSKKSITELLRDLNNTNTLSIGEIFNYYKNTYKGVTGNPIASKTDLRKIAKNLFMLRGIHEPYIQTLVLNKINNSNTRINLKGCIAYLDTIITEKLVETTTHFRKPERGDMSLLEQKLLGWA